MRKRILKFFFKITLVAAFATLVFLQFFQYRLHLINPDFSQSASYDDVNPYNFSIVNSSIKMTSWDSPEAILTIDIINSGKAATRNYCDVNITFLNSRTNAPTMLGVDTDTRLWSKGQITTLEIPVNIRELGYGQYSLFFNVFDDSEHQAIPFNNKLNTEKYGLYLGSLSVSHYIVNF